MSASIILLEDAYFLRDGLTELLTPERYLVSAAKSCQKAGHLLTDPGPVQAQKGYDAHWL